MASTYRALDWFHLACGFSMLPEEGEPSTAVELRHLFPGIADNTKARAHARTILDVRRGAVVLSLDCMRR